MAIIKEFKTIKKKSSDGHMLRTLVAILFLIAFSVAAIPFVIVGAIFYLCLPKRAKPAFSEFINATGHNFDEVLRMFDENYKKS